MGDDPIDSLARTIWLAAAQLAPEPMLEEVLMRAVAIDPADEDGYEQGTQALQRLRELGLIERSADGYRLHRLLGAYARSVSPDCAADWRRAARGLAQTIQRLNNEGELSAPPFRDHIRRLLDAQMTGRDADSAALFHAAGLVMGSWTPTTTTPPPAATTKKRWTSKRQ
ncbi:MAG: hypothetical protein ACUVSL_00195, partial [Chloroflexus sp.]|uniref:hypothetical protein n=1 Tax=Chloroflexus sp. TaxID=1904827 RepID=UPI0040499AF4